MARRSSRSVCVCVCESAVPAPLRSLLLGRDNTATTARGSLRRRRRARGAGEQRSAKRKVGEGKEGAKERADVVFESHLLLFLAERATCV